ncbi:MAG TPA: hypothetical protein QF851_01615 [Flavobacteriales bacterium]|nr:hypothetical protein [Flavobacteriales bacterium]
MNFKTTLIALLCPLFIFSQNMSEKKREKIEIQKVAFITTQLDLTTEEAQVFWPVYNEFSDAMLEIYNQRKDNNKEYKKNIDDLSDGEIEKIVSSNFDLIQKELDIKKKYHLKFKKILSIRKVAHLYHAEKEFKRELLQRIKRGKENHKKRK